MSLSVCPALTVPGRVTREVLFHEAFEPEFDTLQEDVQDELLAQAKLLRANSG
jgi:hypothetical protein